MVNKKIITFFFSLVIFPSLYSMDNITDIASNLGSKVIPLGFGLVQAIINNPQLATGGIAGASLTSIYYKKFAIEPNEKSIKKHKETLEALKEQSGNMLKMLNSLPKQVENNNDALKEQSNKIEATTNDLKTLISTLDSLNTDKEELEKKLENINNTESEYLEKATEIQNQVNLYNKNIADLNAQVTNLSNQLKKNNNKLNQQITELEKKSVENIQQIKTIKDTSQQIEQKTLELKENTKKATTKIRNLLVEDVVNSSNIAEQINNELLAREQERMEQDKNLENILLQAQNQFDNKLAESRTNLEKECAKRLDAFYKRINKASESIKQLNIQINPNYQELD